MDKILTMPSLWAILPDQVGITQHAFMAYLKSVLKVDVKTPTPEANIFDVDLNDMPSTFFMDGDIAIMQIEGVITPKADIFSRIFGGATLDVMTRDFEALIADSNVKAIILDIDSPGGVAFGIEQFANIVFEGRAEKPVIAFTSTMMASAAMWIGAAAHKVFISGEVVMTGSIGTVINHIDISGLEKELGIKTTEITAGKFKRISSNFEPLSKEGRAELQSQVDHVNSAFVASVASSRGTTIEDVNSNMADGKTFIGSQGIEAGLIDGIITEDKLVELINSSLKAEEDEAAQRANSNDNLNKGTRMFGKGVKASAEVLRTEHPDIYQEVMALGEAEGQGNIEAVKTEAYSAGKEAGKTEGLAAGEGIGAKNELARVLAVEASCMPGHKKLIASLVADGTTTGPEAAAQVVAAENSKRATGLANLEKEAVDPVKPETTDSSVPEANTPDEVLKAAWDGKDGDKLKAEFGDKGYDSYVGYYKADASFQKTGKVVL